jgi:predicted transcriptional regulator
MSKMLRRTVESLVRDKAPGPAVAFSVSHLLLALELIALKPLGRNRLAEELGVGEGTVRTLIGRLRDAGLISISKSGCVLTEKGTKLWKEYTSNLKKTTVEKNELAFAEFNVAVLIRKKADGVSSGMEQRDAAVMAGAKGATTVLFKKNRLVFPSSETDVTESSPKASSQIMKLLKPEENDAIIIVSSGDRKKATQGALAAAWTLLD